MRTLVIFFIFVPMLAMILLLVSFFLAPNLADSEKLSPYECGFTPIEGQTRAPFSIHFYIVAILFLVFDLEILLLYPIGVTLLEVTPYGFVFVLIFFTILTVGFIFEFVKGLLNFPEFREMPNSFDKHNLNGVILKVQTEYN
jgi:NADH-ubiquinone oxidoreductase chain 3